MKNTVILLGLMFAAAAAGASFVSMVETRVRGAAVNETTLVQPTDFDTMDFYAPELAELAAYDPDGWAALTSEGDPTDAELLAWTNEVRQQIFVQTHGRRYNLED